ncbi:MAG: ribosome-associated translation inhibitor RaiA [Acidobacteria bacterium]|nr:ribosome-associated translation inhibitor RaiA [Acidobacteriota bacterium]MCA1608683.1 ribosome-associated translation inhibitor RaiA [Acidobacteriota bacterium]
MKFEYTGRHVDVSPALRTHIEDHFSRIDHLFNGKPANAHVIIEVEKGRHRSEVVLNWRNEVLTAATTMSDMYQSLSRTIGKIEKQALRLKTKVIDKSHRRTKVGVIEAGNNEVVPAAAAPRIVRTRRYAIKPMAEDEAALALSSDGSNFLVFRNSGSEKVAVIYKREDGNYGLIEPQ